MQHTLCAYNIVNGSEKTSLFASLINYGFFFLCSQSRRRLIIKIHNLHLVAKLLEFFNNLLR